MSSNVPEWVKNRALAIMGHRPVADKMSFGFDEVTAEQRDALLRWWDAWVEPLALAIVHGDYEEERWRDRYISDDVATGERRRQELYHLRRAMKASEEAA